MDSSSQVHHNIEQVSHIKAQSFNRSIFRASNDGPLFASDTTVFRYFMFEVRDAELLNSISDPFMRRLRRSNVQNMGRGRVDFDHGIIRMTSYARYHGHANPKSDEVWLGWRVGLWVSNLRGKFRSGKLTDAQIAEAKAIGIRFAPPYRDPKPKPLSGAERRLDECLERLSQLKSYYRQHGHINVAQISGIDGWPGAGRWIARIRSKYRQGTLPGPVQVEAERMNINWNPGPGARS